MSFLRYLILLSLVVWIGGLIFFAFVLAPTVFNPSVLPTRQLAGNVVNRSLGDPALDGDFLRRGLRHHLDDRLPRGEWRRQPFAARNLLVYLMIILTLIGMFAIPSRMQVLRQQMGLIDEVPQDDARRVEFNRLHVWSTRIEGTVLLLGTGIAVSHGAAVIIRSCQLQAFRSQPSPKSVSAIRLCRRLIFVPSHSIVLPRRHCVTIILKEQPVTRL